MIIHCIYHTSSISLFSLSDIIFKSAPSLTRPQQYIMLYLLYYIILYYIILYYIMLYYKYLDTEIIAVLVPDRSLAVGAAPLRERDERKR
jgi:hypothetical protein